MSRSAGLIAKLCNALQPLYGEGRQDDPTIFGAMFEV